MYITLTYTSHFTQFSGGAPGALAVLPLLFKLIFYHPICKGRMPGICYGGTKDGVWGTEVSQQGLGRSPQKPETHAEYSTEQNT